MLDLPAGLAYQRLGGRRASPPAGAARTASRRRHPGRAGPRKLAHSPAAPSPPSCSSRSTSPSSASTRCNSAAARRARPAGNGHGSPSRRRVRPGPTGARRTVARGGRGGEARRHLDPITSSPHCRHPAPSRPWAAPSREAWSCRAACLPSSDILAAESFCRSLSCLLSDGGRLLLSGEGAGVALGGETAARRHLHDLRAREARPSGGFSFLRGLFARLEDPHEM